MESDYEYFEREVLRLTGLDLHLYKEKQMRRRLNTRLGRMGLPDFAAYVELLNSDPQEVDDLVDYITINVSEFFRTPDHWRYMEEYAAAQLADDLARRTSERDPIKHGLKVWSCACATGEEPYSLVMSLEKYVPLDRIEVLATDVDERVLEKAAAGFYLAKQLEQVPPKLRKRHFRKASQQESAGYWEEHGTSRPYGPGLERELWRVSDEVRQRVTFRRMDLLQDDYPQDCDLIVCRNVLIYFTEEAKNRIYGKVLESLRPGGFLFTGNAEQLVQYKAHGYRKIKSFLYQR